MAPSELDLTLVNRIKSGSSIKVGTHGHVLGNIFLS
jgi:hypothetical protein